MIRQFGASALLVLAIAMPAQEAAAQDPLAGAILGGAAGAILGGAITGRGGGAAVGAIIGATTGAMIAAEGQRRGGYYYWRNGCYVQQPDGSYVVVAPRYCGPVAVYQPQPVVDDATAYCMRRFRSYDPVSGTYLGFDGLRHPCP